MSRMGQNDNSRGGCGCDITPSCGCPTPSCGQNKKHKKEKKCRTYSLVTKNPYDVGITKSLSSGEFLVLLSGNHHATTDFDRDRLPDWIALGERPCRQYKSLTTEELVEYWTLKKKPCNDPCLHKTSFDICHPNGFINYYTTDGYNRSQAIEVTDATVDSSQRDHALVLKVRLLHQDGEAPNLDGLYPRMFKVSLVLDGWCYKKQHHKGRTPTIIPIMESAPAAPSITLSPTFSDIGSGETATGGGGATATGGQATSDVKQQTTATSTSTATAAINKPKKDKKKKKEKKKEKKKNKCDKIKDKKKKKKCLKKLHEHHQHHHRSSSDLEQLGEKKKA